MSHADHSANAKSALGASADLVVISSAAENRFIDEELFATWDQSSLNLGSAYWIGAKSDGAGKVTVTHHSSQTTIFDLIIY